MLIPMRVTDVLRTKGTSTSGVHGFSSHTPFRLDLPPTLLRNSVAPNSFTSYFHSPVCSCRKVIAHHEARIFLGTDVVSSDFSTHGSAEKGANTGLRC